MTRGFLDDLDRTLALSAASPALLAKDRRTVIRAGITSESALLRCASDRRVTSSALAVVGWLLPRWPGGARRAAFLRAAESLLSHPSSKVRAEAAVSLGLFRLRNATPALVRALDDPDDEVRVRAIASLGLRGDRRALPALARLLSDRRESAEVRATAAEALSGFEASFVAALVQNGLLDSLAAVRAGAAHAAGELRVRSVISTLRELAERDPSARVRAQARNALKAIPKESR